MPWRYKGRAHTDPTKPQAQGVCDRCGIWWNLYQLLFQYDWSGTQLVNKQIRVCPICYDKPQEQLRTIKLPADPLPVPYPRPELFGLIENNVSPLYNWDVPFGSWDSAIPPNEWDQVP